MREQGLIPGRWFCRLSPTLLGVLCFSNTYIRHAFRPEVIKSDNFVLLFPSKLLLVLSFPIAFDRNVKQLIAYTLCTAKTMPGAACIIILVTCT